MKAFVYLLAIAVFVVPILAFAQALDGGALVTVVGPTLTTVSAPQPIMSQIIAVIFTVVLMPLLKAAFDYLKAMTATTAFSGAVDALEAYVDSAVSTLKADIDVALADDGKISSDEMAKIVADLKVKLPAQLLTTIESHLGGGIEVYLIGLVHDAITQRQKALADAAGAKAAAAIDTVEAAMAARKARAVAPVSP